MRERTEKKKRAKAGSQRIPTLLEQAPEKKRPKAKVGRKLGEEML